MLAISIENGLGTVYSKDGTNLTDTNCEIASY